MSYNEEMFTQFFNSIESLRAQELLVRQKADLLDDFVSQLTITRNDGTKLYVSL